MILQRTSHAVYEAKYHLVWAPKYRKWVLKDAVREGVRELLQEISHHHGFEIEDMEVVQNHVHIFLSFPPRYSVANVVGMLKSISASEIFEEFLRVKKELWGGEFWEDGYFFQTVGDRVTADEIKRYIQHHKDPKCKQLQLF